MRKKFVFLAAVLLCLGGCQSEEKQPPQAEEAVPLTQETEEDLLEYDTELPEQLSDFQFAIDEEVYTLPDSIEAWKKQGWELEGENKEKLLEADSFVEGKRLIRGEDSLDAVLVNLEGESKSMDTCSVGGIVLDYQEEGRLYELPGEIYLGRTKLSQVEEQYGTPTDEYEEKEDIYLTYEYGIYKKAELVFHMEDETLYRVSLHNYRELPEEEAEVSREEPQEVRDYQAPEDFSENPRDYVVSYDNQWYQIPAPVSEFEKNGWKIQKDGSDVYVKPGRHGYVTLEKDGHILYAVVKNYSEQTLDVKYAFLTGLSGDFDVTKVPIAVGNNITLGMSEEEMKIRLGGNAFEEEEEEQGTSYYLYSDETKKNFIRIFVDKDLKLIREIQVSNSPKTLISEEKKVSADS